MQNARHAEYNYRYVSSRSQQRRSRERKRVTWNAKVTFAYHDECAARADIRSCAARLENNNPDSTRMLRYRKHKSQHFAPTKTARRLFSLRYISVDGRREGGRP